MMLLILDQQVGDVGPILDMMATVLENISTTAAVAKTTVYSIPTAAVARATVSSIYRAALIAASIPNISYHKKVSLFISFSSIFCVKLCDDISSTRCSYLSLSINFVMQAFPEALFHQLLILMSHPDHETRVGSHRVFSAVLAASVVTCWPFQFIPFLSKKGYDPQSTLLVSLSGFSSTEAVLEKMEKNGCSIQNLYSGRSDTSDAGVDGMKEEQSQLVNGDIKRYAVHPSRSEQHSIKLAPPCAVFGGRVVSESEKEVWTLDFIMCT